MLERRAFWFLRHGETDWNARNLSQGSSDIPLNANGLRQAEKAAAQLVGRGIETVFASPLARAERTAAIIAEHLGVPVAIVPDLREAAFGMREGQPMGEWFTAWVAGQATPESAESFAALRARAVAALNPLLAAPRLALIVAHGSLFRAVRAEMGLSPKVRTPNATPLLCLPPTSAGAPWRLLSPEEAASI
jgi:probable phosphoglycerate mutase